MSQRKRPRRKRRIQNSLVESRVGDREETKDRCSRGMYLSRSGFQNLWWRYGHGRYKFKYRDWKENSRSKQDYL